jgi:hypothetical protein
MKKRRVRRFNEGELVDSFSEDYGMGSREEMIERNIEGNESRRDRTAPVRTPEITRTTTIEEFNEPGSAGFSRSATKASQAKAPVVTKEQVQKAGYDNLRDYLNAQKGLTRRGESKPVAKASSRSGEVPSVAEIERQQRTTGTGTDFATKASEGLSDTAKKALAATAGTAGAGLGLYKLMKMGKDAGKAASVASRVEPKLEQAARMEAKGPSADYYYGAKSAQMGGNKIAGELATRSGELAAKAPKGELTTKGSELVKRREPMAQLESPRRRLPFEKDMGKARLETQANKRRQLGGSSRSDDAIEMGMKRGGKVGSASSRGDGIAKRGKTRGRYI